MRYLKSVLFSTLLLCASSAWAQAVGTHAAGNPGSRYYTQTFTTVGANTWVVPTGISSMWVTGISGGGGGAGGFANDVQGGGGGGAAGYPASRERITVTSGSTLTITVGAAGLGGAIGAAGGVVNTTTSIGGLPIGTWYLIPPTAAGAGTATNGGAGGSLGTIGGGGATGTGAGANASFQGLRYHGGEYLQVQGGGAGGGATGPGAGGQTFSVGNYTVTGGNVSGGAVAGGRAGGGAGGSSPWGVGGAGGSNAAGSACTVGYGAGGGGGASNKAGGDGCQGFVTLEWFN